MAKPSHEWVGSSCHVHGSLWRDGENAFAGESETFRYFLAGWIAGARELAVFVAPNVNSYKRYSAGSWAPTTLAWGYDNRTVGLRVPNSGPEARRIENRIPSSDANPYLAIAASLACGYLGMIEGLQVSDPVTGAANEEAPEPPGRGWWQRTFGA